MIDAQDQQSGELPQPSFVPDEAWLDAFEAQNTSDLRKKAKRFARSRARFVAAAGGCADDYYISSLVQDVLGDILLGVLVWDPGTISLETILLHQIRSRTHHDAKRASSHRRIDVFDPAADTRAVMTAVESSLAEAAEEPAAEALLFYDQVLGQVRGLAKDDGDVLRIVNAIAAGAENRADVITLANMSEKTYHKAHIRLGRMIDQLPNKLVNDLRARG